MRILIGGSPSTGSSVFRQILNRHPKIFCGPETNLFCYPELYRNWKYARKRMFLPGPLGLNKVDVRHIHGVRLEDDELGWTQGKLRSLIDSQSSFTAFCNVFFEKPLEQYGKMHWAEKTPANVLQFKNFLKSFEDAFLIHIVRNPYDTVASLMARGMSVYEAASVYLLYTAHGLSAKEMTGYLQVSYESLVNNAEDIIDQQVLHPLGLAYLPEMLRTGNEAMTGISKMEGWRSDELDTLSDKSLSRFQDETEERQVEIASALSMIRIEDGYLKKNRLSHNSMRGVCADLDYPFHEHLIRKDHYDERLHKEQKRVIRKLWMARVLSFGERYPVLIT